MSRQVRPSTLLVCMLGAALVITAGLALPGLRTGLDRDEGLFLVRGMHVMATGDLYTGLDAGPQPRAKGPLFVALMAGVQAVGDGRTAPVRVASLLLRLLAVACTGWALWRHLQPRGRWAAAAGAGLGATWCAAVASRPGWFAPALLSETAEMALCAVAAALWLAGGRRATIAAAVAVGLAPWCRQTSAALLAAWLAWAVAASRSADDEARPRAPRRSVMIALVAGLLGPAVVLALIGELGPFLHWQGVSLREVGTNVASGAQDWNYPGLGFRSRIAGGLLADAPVLWALAAAAVIGLGARGDRTGRSLALWAALMGVGSFFLPAVYAHHVLGLAVPGGLAVGVAAAAVCRDRRAVTAVVAVAVLLGGLHLWHAVPEARRQAEDGRLYPATLSRSTQEAVAAHPTVRAADSVWVFPGEPQLYYVTGRRPPFGALHNEAVHLARWTPEQTGTRLLEPLARVRPEVVLLAENEHLQPLADTDAGRAVLDAVEAGWTEVGRIGRVRILHRRDAVR